jgi:glycine oxidase
MADCIVVGAGLIGMLTARELALAGAHVRIIERDSSPRESSWAGGGILSPLYPWRYPEAVTLLARWGQARYQALADELINETDIDPEWRDSGLLVMDAAAEERDAAVQWAVQYGYELELLENGALQSCEPMLNRHFTKGLWLPEVAQLRNPRLLKALRENLDDIGATFSEQCAVNAVAIKNGRLVGVQTEQGLIRGERVIIAGGAWSGSLLEELGYPIPIEPVKGQMLLFNADPSLLHRILLYKGHYVIPRRDGHILAGSTLELSGFDKQTTAEGLVELRQAAFELVPALERCPIEKQWAGLRPGSLTGIPYIGEHPEIRGLYINSGHFRNGVVLGLASARLLADLLLEREPILEPYPYRWDRPGETGSYTA